MDRLKTHAALVQLENVDEPTFRSFVIAEIKRLNPAIEAETEWHRVDLHLQNGLEQAIVEFKFYVVRPRRSIDGTQIGWKGGAGLKNQGELSECIEKTKAFSAAEVRYRFIVLVYENSKKRRSKYSFSDNYRDLNRFGVDVVESVAHGFKEMECKLIDLSHLQMREKGDTGGSVVDNLMFSSTDVEASPNTMTHSSQQPVSSHAVTSFFHGQLAENREATHEPVTKLYFRVRGKRRWFVRANKNWAYVWQYGRFEDDVVFWRALLSDPESVKSIKNGQCLSFNLHTTDDFGAFNKVATNFECSPMRFTN